MDDRSCYAQLCGAWVGSEAARALCGANLTPFRPALAICLSTRMHFHCPSEFKRYDSTVFNALLVHDSA